MNTHAKESLPSLIDQAWENRANYSSQNAPAELHAAVAEVIQGLDDGSLRVATRKAVGQWEVHQWIKKAVLLSFKLQDNEVMTAGGFTQFFDKVPSKFANYSPADFQKGGFRVVPPAIARRGSFIGKNVILCQYRRLCR